VNQEQNALEPHSSPICWVLRWSELVFRKKKEKKEKKEKKKVSKNNNKIKIKIYSVALAQLGIVEAPGARTVGESIRTEPIKK
jgi:translation initiation factor IF-3